MLISAAILLITCTKENSIPGTGTPTGIQEIAGSIVDQGVITGEVRHMSLTLTGVSVIVNGSEDNPEQTSSNITIELFTNTDGIINDGVYHFSDAENPEPFTFKSGSVYMGLGDSEEAGYFILHSGTISVRRDGPSYQISLDGTLATGHSINGSFEGQLHYRDADM